MTRVQFITQTALPHRTKDAESLARPGQVQGYEQLPTLYSASERAIFVDQQAQDLITLGVARLSE